jgi:hypothetical protein
MLRETEAGSSKHSANISEVETSSSEDEAEDEKASLKEMQQAEEMANAEVEEPPSDTEDVKLANAKAYAAAMNRSVGGPDNAAALRAKKILES